MVKRGEEKGEFFVTMRRMPKNNNEAKLKVISTSPVPPNTYIGLLE